MHLKRNGVIKMTTMNDDLFDIAMSLACDSDLESELALFRSFDEIPCSFSEEHCRNIRYILSHNGRRPIWKRKMVFAHFTARRMAASIAVVFSLVLCGCACFPTVRAAVRELAVEFYDQYVGITDDSNAVLKEPMVHHFPTYIPEGYEIEKEDLTIAGGRIIYTNDGKGKIQYFQFYNKHATMYFDFEGAMLSDVFVNEYRGKYLEYTDERKTQNIIMWTDGTYTYYIIGELAYEELKMMAESVS